ncbi:conserved membrane hypothetical protein [Microbacterium sp. 8M]|uniref:hypothetical protein n=1 Tax=Microbacterium sp. 8M TaxID=2653153 RepID=UPI0012F296F8|nr:hypothetical protein [Microbacterium sp. 8M]VXB13287.1 conserved membrane hypothetical protein [Microbacterium sp. 8M]
MSEPSPARVHSGSGLRAILLATAVAGGIGYLIQAVVPRLVSHETYLTFQTFWSSTYLVVSCLAGLQQELTRASRAGPDGSGHRTWRAFALIAAVTSAVVVAVLFGLIGPHVFPADTASLVAAIALAALGYGLIAAVSGAMYGVQDWTGVGGMTIGDSVLRAIAIALALCAGGSAILLAWAVAVPFLVAAIAIWLWRGRRIAAHLQLDVGMSALFRNTAATLLASLATGALISGLPLLLRAFAADAGTGLLASVILAISLTRAPLVVPLVALQGYLLVRFRDARGHVGIVLRWVVALLALIAALAGLAAWLGPLVLAWLYPDYVALDGGVLAAIVASAGLTGILCLTGPAVLAAHRHRWYVAGWLVSACLTVLILLAPWEPLPRILLALTVAPVIGGIVHVIELARIGTAQEAGVTSER